MDIYKRLKVKKIINASTNETKLGGSMLSTEVLEAMNEAAKYHVDMDELNWRAGEIIAEITGAEAGFVTSGSAASLVVATAACMTGSNRNKMRQLPNTEGLKNEVIIQKGHVYEATPFYRYPLLAGAKFVVVGNEHQTLPREIEEAITERTAAILYMVVREDTKGMQLTIKAYSREDNQVPLEDVCTIAHKYGVPVIVDAAGEIPPVENMKKFIALKADLVAFSGGKGVQGPMNTGILCGRKDLIEAVAAQYCPHHGIGRPMKVSKECIVGIITALQQYVKTGAATEYSAWESKAKYIVEELKCLPHVEANLITGDVGSASNVVPMAHLELDEETLGKTVSEVVKLLGEGDRPIVVACHGPTRPYIKPNAILLNPRYLREGEEKIVVKKLKEICIQTHAYNASPLDQNPST
jgi:uncharacterized pyridoxal phosphate-dependent enzyme